MNSILLTELCSNDLKLRLKPTKTVDKSAPVIHVEGEILKSFMPTPPVTILEPAQAPHPPPPPPPLLLKDLKLPKKPTTNQQVKSNFKKENLVINGANTVDRDKLLNDIKAGNFKLRKTGQKLSYMLDINKQLDDTETVASGNHGSMTEPKFATDEQDSCDQKLSDQLRIEISKLIKNYENEQLFEPFSIT